MTKIEYLDKTWNFIGGCSECSPGCGHCWAARQASGRFLKNHPLYRGLTHKGKWTGEIRLCTDIGRKDILEKPLHWTKPSRIGVQFMGDLFHPSVPFEFIDRVHTAMIMAYRKGYYHIYQILTKHDKRMLKYYSSNRRKQLFAILEKDYDEITGFYGINWPLPNLHLGVSAENQEMADKRIPILLQIPAAKRFVSFEPLLGDIGYYKPGIGRFPSLPPHDLPNYAEHQHIDQIIIGAESKGGAPGRYCDIEWIRSLVQQGKAAGIPVFVKQIHIGTPDKYRLSKKMSEWPKEIQVRDYAGK